MQELSRPRPIAVVGPTASGKSELGLQLAERLGGEIVNVDSMQLYRGMDIGTAKLPVLERRGIVHHQLDKLAVTEPASVATYQAEAAADVEDIRARGRVPVLVGGSMLYYQALVDNFRFPPTDPAVRARFRGLVDELGTEGAHYELARRDPEAAGVIEAHDARRIVRALEVIELTGKPFAASQPPRNTPPRWGTRIVGLAAAPEWLADRIDARTRGMFAAGLEDEVERLIGQGLVRDSTAGRAIGYAQVLAMRAGEIDREQAVEQTIFGTRRYVRRQRSWFKRDARIAWIDAQQANAARALDALRAASRNP
ncbi:tRNA delta(2)-isopentenylpyrophosphate transferase [Corynebacterium atypicum]|uniref:tRNA dimethylallyltransferase n=1 Tax=Corynebacterium atypicum TaxID=191610 RepID=A0ABN4DCQ3_9CORY|nr:tRNA (adenosine(37)-N6)-dimethylallyltransferase MiaA [Corynebacterium atypicum]AIG64007.1 tRNA delta(2)-isopentenylpyrophosphate transferase [Corynebacterium atypicum]